jgi:F-type H+-transporting ATPase subunit b
MPPSFSSCSKKPIKEFFGGREQSYKQALAKAQAARVEAEAKRKEMQERLTQLESSSAEAIAKARAEAESLKQKIVADAGQLSELLKEEAKKTAQIEIDRARNELREELLSQSVALSTKLLQDKMVAKDQERLQTEFVDKIQVVGQ